MDLGPGSTDHLGDPGRLRPLTRQARAVSSILEVTPYECRVRVKLYGHNLIVIRSEYSENEVRVECKLG